ncbi:hypothetical protein AM218_10585 [Hymenobacter sp. DG25A]|nr:hypothetical protein AM218_10585 [Hymenobacter sp. DG25A]
MLLLAVVCCGFASQALAQADPIKFGKVSVADFTPLAADSAAPAVVLCDFGVSKVVGGDDGFRLNFERTTRILIRRKAGYDWATVEVPLYHHDERTERIKTLKGTTYNLEGGKLIATKMGSESIFQDKVDKEHNSCRFTLPNVKEGSIIEFTYTVSSDFLFNLQDWQFQHTIPVRWSEYRTLIPAYFRYKQITRGYLPFAVQEEKVVPYSTQISYSVNSVAPKQETTISNNALSSRWVMQNVPALNEEPFITTTRDYFSSIEFELAVIQYYNQPPQDVANTWEKITEDLLKQEHFGQDLHRATPLAPAMAELPARYPEALARAAAVLAQVQQAVKYNGQERIYTEGTLKQAVQKGQGNSAAVNLLLVQALREAGLNATPLILSTRSHGQVLLDMPVLNHFNYVVAHMRLSDGKEYLLDATDPLLPVGMLPVRCLNGQGRLITDIPAQSRWVSLSPVQRHSTYSNASITLAPDGALHGKGHWEWSGYAGLEARTAGTADLVRTVRQQLGEETSGPAPVLPAVADVSKPLALDMAIQIPRGEGGAAGTIYLTPMKHFGLTSNPLRADSRYFPVDFGMGHDGVHLITMTLPKGYTVVELPKSQALTLPNGGGQFHYSCQQQGNTITIASRLSLLKTQYPAAEYSALRELYDRVAAKHAEPLVLSKAPGTQP